jgi:hypothetical protein
MPTRRSIGASRSLFEGAGHDVINVIRASPMEANINIATSRVYGRAGNPIPANQCGAVRGARLRECLVPSKL